MFLKKFGNTYFNLENISTIRVANNSVYIRFIGSSEEEEWFGEDVVGPAVEFLKSAKC